MKPKYKQIARRQLDVALSKFGEVKNVQLPAKGWIRAVREALGMSGTQLAGRLQVSQPRVFKLEQGETTGGVDLENHAAGGRGSGLCLCVRSRPTLFSGGDRTNPGPGGGCRAAAAGVPHHAA